MHKEWVPLYHRFLSYIQVTQAHFLLSEFNRIGWIQLVILFFWYGYWLLGMVDTIHSWYGRFLPQLNTLQDSHGLVSSWGFQIWEWESYRKRKYLKMVILPHAPFNGCFSRGKNRVVLYSQYRRSYSNSLIWGDNRCP